MTKNNGVTIISLVVTIIVLSILAGVSLGIVTSKDFGIADKTKNSKESIEKGTLIQKIQADIFTENTKKGRTLTQEEKENVIKNYGTITEENGEKVLTTSEGNYKILLSEII